MRETPYLNQSQQSQSILSEHSDLMCTIAYSTLEVFVSKCQKGAVTLHDINVIADNKVKMLKLYTATITGKLEGGKLAETDEFQILLEHRIQESKTFLEKWSMLNLFCQHLKQSKVLVVGKFLCDLILCQGSVHFTMYNLKKCKRVLQTG